MVMMDTTTIVIDLPSWDNLADLTDVIIERLGDK
jgi:hypothetical protein